MHNWKMIGGHHLCVTLCEIVLTYPLHLFLALSFQFGSNPRNPDHKKYSGPHGRCESVKRRKYNC